MEQPERIRMRRAADPNSLVAQYARTDTRKFLFGVRVVEPWNKLDGETRNCEANKAFKNKLKRRQK
jgi:hypothetical protein